MVVISQNGVASRRGTSALPWLSPSEGPGFSRAESTRRVAPTALPKAAP